MSMSMEGVKEKIKETIYMYVITTRNGTDNNIKSILKK